MSVYTMGGPFSGAEKDIQKRLVSLNDQIRIHTKKIDNILTNALTEPQRSNKYWASIQRDLEIQYKALFQVYDEWSKVEIPDVYKDSLTSINKQISNMANVSKKAQKSIDQIMKSNITNQLTTALYKDSLASWSSGLTGGFSNMTRLTRMTQQKLTEEFIIDKSVAQAIESGDLRNFANIWAKNDPQYKALLNAAKEHRYIQAGSRKYTPEYYAEMVARVKFHEAQAAAALTQAKNYDTDLVVVSSHNTTTEICQEFESRIFSITGKDKRFPVLTQRPPYHVNCLHLLFPQFVEALEASGTLDGFSDFSKGETEAPPYPSNFIPIKDRPDPARIPKKDAKKPDPNPPKKIDLSDLDGIK